MLFPWAEVAPPAELPVVGFAGPAVAAGSVLAGAVEDDAEASEVGAFPGTHIFR
jgi:hypothetical protein